MKTGEEVSAVLQGLDDFPGGGADCQSCVDRRKATEAPKKAKKPGQRRHWKRKAAKPVPDRREEDRQFWRAVFGGEPPERHR